MKPVYIEIDKYGDRRYYSDAAMKTLHRTDGPAIERALAFPPFGAKEWYLNGKRHRTEGPAIEYCDGCKEWYLNGKHLSEADFLTATATDCGMVSKQMLYDSEQEVSVLLGKLAAAENALRELACFMSCGGYNDEGLIEFDPAHYAKKIKEAIIHDRKTIN